VIRGRDNADFWDGHQHEFAVYGTNLLTSCSPSQIQSPFRQRAETENVFEKLKNQ
jgi:hypothetical protein